MLYKLRICHVQQIIIKMLLGFLRCITSLSANFPLSFVHSLSVDVASTKYSLSHSSEHCSNVQICVMKKQRIAKFFVFGT